MRNVTECQQRLIELKYLSPLNAKGEPNADGRFGALSVDAYNRFRTSRGNPPVFPPVHLDQLNADLFPEDAPAPKPKGNPVNIASWFNNAVILGIVRNILMAVGAGLVTKGVIDNATLTEVVGAIIAILSAIMSGISNNNKHVNDAIVKAVEAHPDITVVPAAATSSGAPKVLVNK